MASANSAHMVIQTLDEITLEQVKGKTVTFSGWYTGSTTSAVAGYKLDISVSGGNPAKTNLAVESVGEWTQVQVTCTVPEDAAGYSYVT